MLRKAFVEFRTFIYLLASEFLIFLIFLVFGPSRMGIFLFALFIVCSVLFLSYEKALLFTIVSLPLMPVLPAISDTFSVWRILVLILFIRYVYRKKKTILASVRHIKIKDLLLESKGLYFFEAALIMFVFFAVLSALQAPYFVAAIKQIIFYLTVAVFGALVYLYIQTKTNLHRIIGAFLSATGIIIVFGIFQFVLARTLTLHNFWQFWAENVIPIFYGGAMGELLSYSNTWFSYFGDGNAGLRMFSVFPDSHSFAIFLIFGFSLSFFTVYEGIVQRKKIFLPLLLTVVSLLCIVFSGSRGAWLSIIGPAILAFAAWFFKKGDRRFPMLMGLMVLIFILLFPVSSLVVPTTYDEKPGESGNSSFMFKRAISIIDRNEESNKGRIEIWQETASFVLENPLLGVGPGNFPLVLKEDISAAKKGASAHNLYLHILSETGILGLSSFVLALFTIFIVLYRLSFDVSLAEFRAFGWCAGFGYLWAMTYGLFDVVLLNDKALIFFAGFIGITCAIYRKSHLHHTRTVYSQ